LIFTPYSVDNQRFDVANKELSPVRETLRRAKGLKSDVLYALYSGKYMPKKRPMDLLAAIHILQQDGEKIGGIFMGDGALRGEMEQYIQNNKVQDIILTGFINQTEIPTFYAAADFFVMCSDAAETWGLSTNEAMNFGLPVILSDKVGSAADLVVEGTTGFTFACGDVSALVNKIKFVIDHTDWRISARQLIIQLISQYDYKVISHNISQNQE
jgi:glycosyltransferase involved in cell wall biosynthesis